MPHHSERDYYGRGEGYYPSHDPESSEYADNDYNQPCHGLNTDERKVEVEKPPPQVVSAEVLFGTADQRKRPTHVSLFMCLLMGYKFITSI